MSGKSKVYLISAGIGAVEFITIKVLRLIQQADVVVYDHLVAAELLAFIPRGTARILAGRPYGAHRHNQHELYELLLRLAPGRCVVYLKGSNPTMTGDGGEESHFLAQYGIHCEVVLDASPTASSAYPEISHARCH